MARSSFLAVILGSLLVCAGARWAFADPPAASNTTPAQPGNAKAAGKAVGSSKSSGGQKASTQAKPGEKQLSQLVVTATRIAQPLADIGTTLSVVTDKQINDQKIQQAANALREVPGVIVTQLGSPGTESDVSIRGASSSQTLILIDGVEVNTGTTGAFDMANLTTDNVDRIEVLRGAGGALYGSQAIGGVVNVLSQEGEGPAKATFLSEGGTRASELQQATLNGSYEKLGYSAAISYFSTEGYRLVNDNSDNLSGSLRLDYHLSDKTTFRGFARYIRSNVSLPTFSIALGSLLNPNAHQRGEFMLFKGEIEHHFNEHFMLRSFTSFVRNDIRDNSTPYFGNQQNEVDHIPEEIRGGNIEGLITWFDSSRKFLGIDLEGFRTLLGFDFKDRWARSTSVFDDPVFGPPSISDFNARRQEYAGYLEQEGSFFDGHLLATGGFRVDGNSSFGDEESSSWSVAIPLPKFWTTLRGSYSEGFRAPSFDELYFPGFGNPNLSPEISSEYDGGFTTTFGEWGSLTSTYFSRRIHNEIVTIPTNIAPDFSTAGNAARVDTQGVEIVPAVTPMKGLSFSGYVTILDETHVDNSGSTAQPLRVPKYSAASVLQYQFPLGFLPRDRVTANVRYIFVGDRDDLNQEGMVQNLQAYNRVDAVASYAAGVPAWHVHNEEAFIKFTNMLDRSYFEAIGFRAPSFTFAGGIKLTFE